MYQIIFLVYILPILEWSYVTDSAMTRKLYLINQTKLLNWDILNEPWLTQELKDSIKENNKL